MGSQTDHAFSISCNPKRGPLSFVKYYFRCPKCGSDEQFIKPREESTGLGCALFFLGGLIPYLLFASDQQRRIQCVKCGYTFRPPAIPSTPLAKFATWIMGLTMALVFGGALLVASPDAASLLPSAPVIVTMEEVIAAQPRVAAWMVAALFVAIVVSCCAAAWLSNARFRKQLASEYRLKPLTFDEVAQQNSSRLETEAASESREDAGS